MKHSIKSLFLPSLRSQIRFVEHMVKRVISPMRMQNTVRAPESSAADMNGTSNLPLLLPTICDAKLEAARLTIDSIATSRSPAHSIHLL